MTAEQKIVTYLERYNRVLADGLFVEYEIIKDTQVIIRLYKKVTESTRVDSCSVSFSMDDDGFERMWWYLFGARQGKSIYTRYSEECEHL